MNNLPQILALVGLLLPALASATGDAELGKELYTPCAVCHGAAGEGNAALLAPGLAGQSESYLMRQLWDFKKGKRGAAPGDTAGAQMLPMVATLADGKAIADVAAYLAALPAQVPPATVEGNTANGKEQYTSKCGVCHGGDAWGNEAMFTPRLTIVGDSYLLRQINNFQTGVRGAHKEAKLGQQMKAMSLLVSDEEINDIVAYLNELAAQE